MTYYSKINSRRFIFMLMAFIGFSTLVFAQEEGMGELDQDKNPVTEDRSTYTLDSENELIPLKPVVKKTENITSKPNPPKTTKPEERKDPSKQKELTGKSEDQKSIIGYNFLHYFFQKYKMSEISE